MSIEPGRQRRLVPYSTLAVAIPLLPVILFSLLNHFHQRNDESYSLIQTQSAYLYFKNEGLLRALSNIFLERTYRPILHPYLALPFFFVTSGRAEAAACLYEISAYAFFLFFLVRIFQRHLRSAESVLATWLVGLSPIFIFHAEGFKSEVTLLAFASAFFYYLEACEFFSHLRESLLGGIFLGLMFCIRPAETSMLAFFLGLPFFSVALSRSTIRWRDLGVQAVPWFIGLALLFFEQHLSGTGHKNGFAYCLVALVPPLVLPLRRRLGLCSAFLAFSALGLAIPLFWYGPVAQHLFSWIGMNTFSQFAKVTGATHGVGDSKITFFLNVANHLGWPIVAALATIALATRVRAFNNSRAWLLLLPAIVGPPILGSFSQNPDPRYYLLGALIAYVALAILALSPTLSEILRWIRFGVTTAVLVVVTSYHFQLLWGDGGGNLRAFLKGPHMDEPVSHDAIEELFTEFKKTLPASRVFDQDLQICLLQMRQYNDLDWLADPMSLTIMARESGDAYAFQRPFPFSADTIQERFDLVRSTCDYIVVLPVEHQLNATVEHFMSDVGEVVLRDFSQNRIAADKMKLIARGTYRSENGNTATYLLFKSYLRSGL